jgi:sarcosine oxidase delta subunit
MQFLAYCPYCEKKVSASTELDGDALKKALATDATIRIIHLPTGGPDQKMPLW